MSVKINKSKTYLLYYFYNILGLSEVKNLINTYLYFNGASKFCVLYKFSGKKSFYNFEKSITSNKYFCESLDVSIDKVIYIFDIPESKEEVIDIFKKGKYSELPEKEELIAFLKHFYNIGENSKIEKVLRKDEGLKQTIEEKLNVKLGNAELLSIPELEEENFKTNEFVEERETEIIF